MHVEEPSFRLGEPLGPPRKVFHTKRLRRPLDGYVHTLADPFLFVSEAELFLFVEAQAAGAPGHIEAYKTADLDKWTHLGEVLKEPYHLSYPAVFEAGSAVYMIPESAEAGEVALYRFNDFPCSLTKVRTLLTGSFVDTSPVKVSNTWYLFTTSDRGLEIFYTDDLEAGALTPHPTNPLTDDPGYRRCGGLPCWSGGTLYRLAQDCSRHYGGNLNLLEVRALSRTSYSETLAKEGLFDCGNSWNSEGGHHMSLATFMGQSVIAVDGQQYDYYIHKIRKLIPRST